MYPPSRLRPTKCEATLCPSPYDALVRLGTDEAMEPIVRAEAEAAERREAERLEAAARVAAETAAHAEADREAERAAQAAREAEEVEEEQHQQEELEGARAEEVQREEAEHAAELRRQAARDAAPSGAASVMVRSWVFPVAAVVSIFSR